MTFRQANEIALKAGICIDENRRVTKIEAIRHMIAGLPYTVTASGAALMIHRAS